VSYSATAGVGRVFLAVRTPGPAGGPGSAGRR
jgi:hypothetical protein